MPFFDFNQTELIRNSQALGYIQACFTCCLSIRHSKNFSNFKKIFQATFKGGSNSQHSAASARVMIAENLLFELRITDLIAPPNGAKKKNGDKLLNDEWSRMGKENFKKRFDIKRNIAFHTRKLNFKDGNMSTPGISQNTIRLEYDMPNPSYFSAVQSSLLMPYKAVMSFWTLRNIRHHPELSITEQMPHFQIWCEWAANKCGLNPSYPRISELHLPAVSIKKLKLPFTEKEFTLKLPVFNTSHLIKEEFLNKAALKPHRRLEYNGSASYDTFFELTKKIFPETQFDAEDTIFTCGPEFSKIARGCIHDALSASNLNAVLNNQAQSLIERWNGYAASGEKFNVIPETNQFATGVMVEIFLGQEIDSKSICDSVHYMNAYLFRRALGLNTGDEDSKFLESCKVFNEAVNQLLDNETQENPIPLFSQNSKQDENVKLTLPQKQALILTLFFAGQETTSFGLDAHIGFYALNPSEQDEILDALQADNNNIHECKKVKEAVTHRLLEAPPANGVAKKLRSPTRIVFEDTEGKAFSKYMRGGEKIVAVIAHAAHEILKDSSLEDIANPIQLLNRASIFGVGAHGCPGKKLALQELLQLPIIILQNFILMTEEKEFRYHPQLTKQAEPFYITVEHR